MKNKSALLGMLGLAMMLDQPLSEIERPKRKILGNQGWGNSHDAKVKKSRAKERRAKIARKINWS